MDKIVSHKDSDRLAEIVALACKVYAASRLLPRDERFGLQRQLRLAAVAVASRIAEGAASQKPRCNSSSRCLRRGSLAGWRPST